MGYRYSAIEVVERPETGVPVLAGFLVGSVSSRELQLVADLDELRHLLRPQRRSEIVPTFEVWIRQLQAAIFDWNQGHEHQRLRAHTGADALKLIAESAHDAGASIRFSIQVSGDLEAKSMKMAIDEIRQILDLATGPNGALKIVAQAS